jgi:transposase
MNRFTIKDFNTQFPTDDACLEWLRQRRYPELIDCPTCQTSRKFYRVTGRKTYQCGTCNFNLSPTAGTILDHSPTPMRQWFYAIFLMSQTRTGISAKQLQRELGVTYKTAWRMFKLIRTLMEEGTDPLFGDVEADETYIGGKRPGKRGRGAAGKTIVAGLVERGGKAVVQVVPDVKASTLIPIIQANVPLGQGATIHTDEMSSYNRLTSLGYAHNTVQHSAKEYVRGAAHTQTIDGLWSNVKRGIDGVNHAVSPHHLQGYLDSYTFRYNHRDDETPMFQSLLGRVSSESKQ